MRHLSFPQHARGLAFALAALFALPGALRAQAPVITPDGDPSVRDDTIYALTVDPADHPEETVVLLLDDGVLRLEKDGTGTKTYRMAAQILQQQAVQTWSEHTFGYDAEREEFTLNWARVVDGDGRVVAEKPIHVQVLDAPVPEQSPIYTSRKVVRVSLGNVAPGRIVDYSYTVRTKTPVLPGDFHSPWAVTTGGTVRRSRLVLDLPEGLEPTIVERNLDFEPVVQRKGGRVVRSWLRTDLQRIEPELFASDSNTVYQSVQAVGAITWDDVARWYAGLARDRYALTPELESKLGELVSGAATLEDSLRAVYRWVAQDVRYVSISLGMGGYQPRPPAEVVGTMSGDCKDKATLFIALARRLGVEAYPMLVAAGGEARRELPSISEFDHMIAALRRDGGWTFLDLTADIVPFGEIPPAVVEEFGLIVHDDGAAEEVVTPGIPAEQSRSVVAVTGAIDASGHFEGHFTREVSGLLQYDLRGNFAAQFTDRMLEELAHSVAGSIFPGARGDSAEIFDGFDLQATPRIRVRMAADKLLQPAADGWIFMLPLSSYASPQLVAQLEREETRRFPFDAASVFGPQEHVYELRLRLPEGWTAQLPGDVTAESAFGLYETTYRQTGTELVIRRRVRGAEGVLPKEKKTELIEWLNAIGEDDARFLVLHGPKTDD